MSGATTGTGLGLVRGYDWYGATTGTGLRLVRGYQQEWNANSGSHVAGQAGLSIACLHVTGQAGLYVSVNSCWLIPQARSCWCTPHAPPGVGFRTGLGGYAYIQGHICSYVRVNVTPAAGYRVITVVRVVPMVRAIPAVSVVNTFRVVTYRPKMPRSMTPGPWLQVHGSRSMALGLSAPSQDAQSRWGQG